MSLREKISIAMALQRYQKGEWNKEASDYLKSKNRKFPQFPSVNLGSTVSTVSFTTTTTTATKPNMSWIEKISKAMAIQQKNDRDRGSTTVSTTTISKPSNTWPIPNPSTVVNTNEKASPTAGIPPNFSDGLAKMRLIYEKCPGCLLGSNVPTGMG